MLEQPNNIIFKALFIVTITAVGSCATAYGGDTPAKAPSKAQLEQRIRELETKLTDQIGLTSTLRSKLKVVQKDLDKQNAANAEHQRKTELFAEEVAQLSRDVVNQETTIRKLNAIKTTLEKDANRTSQRSDALRKLYIEQEADRQKLSAKLKRAEETIAEQKELAATLQKQLEQGNSTDNDLKAALNTAKKTLQIHKEAAEKNAKRLAAMRSDFSTLQAELSKQATAVAKLEAVNAGLKASTNDRIATLETEVESRDAQVANYRKQLNEANGDIADTNLALELAKGNVARLTKDLERTRNDLTDEKRSLKQLQREHKTLSASHDTELEEAARRKNMLSNAEREIAEKTRQIDELLEQTKRPSRLIVRKQDNGAWLIQGSVASEETKTKVEREFRNVFGEAKLDNQIEVNGRIQPSRWTKGLNGLMNILRDSKVANMQIRIEGDAVALDGEDDSEIKRREIAALLKSIPWGE